MDDTPMLSLLTSLVDKIVPVRGQAKHNDEEPEDDVVVDDVIGGVDVAMESTNEALAFVVAAATTALVDETLVILGPTTTTTNSGCWRCWVSLRLARSASAGLFFASKAVLLLRTHFAI